MMIHRWDVLMISPGLSGEMIYPMAPLGMLWIAAVLAKEGYTVKFLDLQINRESPEQILGQEQAPLVLIGGVTYNRFETFRLVELAKKANPETVTVYGGVHASFTAQDTLQHIREIDIIARGEGEITSLELANCLLRGDRDYSQIDGISFRDGGEIKHNKPRDRIKDLDQLPYPATLLPDWDAYISPLESSDTPSLHTMTSRGCPFNCIFCSSASMWGKMYSTRSAKNVVDEIELFKNRYGIKGMKFYDSTLTLKKSHIISICDELVERKLDILWECDVRADTVSRELLSEMRDSGCRYIGIGLETVSPKVMSTLRKQITVEQVEDTMRWAKELGIEAKVFMIMGLPGEDASTALEAVQFIKEHRDDASKIHIGPAQIYPGTPLEHYAKENGTLPPGFSWSEPFESDEIGELTYARTIPIFKQPTFGMREYHRFKIEVDRLYDRMPTLKTAPAFLFRKISAIRSMRDIKHLWGEARKYIRWWLKP
ncbi:MAG: radical SAM protein [bacterium]|nr:MAG: radical SAM protein [bacterium]